MSGEAWAFIFLFLILKIPVCAALYLVWWSARSPSRGDAEPAVVDGGHRGPRSPRPRRPRPPRRGPHVGPVPQPPQRIRVRAGRPVRTHGSP